MAELAVTAPTCPPAAALLDKKMKKSHAMISAGVVLVAGLLGLGFIGVSIVKDFRNGNRSQLLALSAADLCLADRARL